jgi:hypothetical protein
MSAIIISKLASIFDGACYNKLNSRERNVVDFLLGIDALELVGNKLVARR